MWLGKQGKEFLKAPVRSPSYKVSLLSQKSMLSLNSELQQLSRDSLHFQHEILGKLMGVAPRGLHSFQPLSVTNSLSAKVYFPPALCPP